MPARKHGIGYECKEYRAWRNIKTRCTLPSAYAYRWYGARGIKICDKWNKDFLAFLKDVGPAPAPEYTIDRIDSNGHYEPGNCRWILADEQKRNQTSNVILEYKGESHLQAEWARILNCTYTGIYSHLKRGKPFSEFAEKIEKRNAKRCATVS